MGALTFDIYTYISSYSIDSQLIVALYLQSEAITQLGALMCHILKTQLIRYHMQKASSG